MKIRKWRLVEEWCLWLSAFGWIKPEDWNTNEWDMQLIEWELVEEE